MKNNKINNWTEFDEKINKSGEWLLVGGLSCAGLSPIIGLIGLLVLLLFESTRHDKLNTRIQQLKEKKRSGEVLPNEGNELRANKNIGPQRNIKSFTMGYCFFIAVALYLLLKGYHNPSFKYLLGL